MRGDSSDDNSDDGGGDTDNDAGLESLREKLDMASEVGQLLLSPLRSKGQVDNDECPDSDDESPPLESTSLVSAIFCLLGVGTLLPWNAFISSEPYFHARLCSLFGDGGGGGGGIELYFGLCFNLCGFLSLIVVIATAMKRQEDNAAMVETTSDGNNNARRPVLWALGLYLSLFLVTTGAVLVEDLDPFLFLVATLLSLSVFGSCLAIAGTKIVGIASIFPPQVAIAPFFAGQATGGALISLTNFISATAENPQPFWDENCHGKNRTASDFFFEGVSPSSNEECPAYTRDMPTFWYFFLGSLILMLSFFGFVYMDKMAITKHYRRLASGESSHTHNAGDEIKENVEEPTLPSSNVLTQPLLADEMLPEYPGSDDEINDGDLTSSQASVRCVLSSIRFPALALSMTSFVTLSIFPAFTSTMQSVSMCEETHRLENDLFEPLGFILFNCPDLLARIVAPIFIDIQSIQRQPRLLFVSSAARLIFFPLFIFAKSSSTDLPYVNSDLYSISVAIMFAFSNGLLMSLCFMVAPQLLPDNSTELTRQRGSDFMNLSLALGLLSGSFASFFFNRL